MPFTKLFRRTAAAVLAALILLTTLPVLAAEYGQGTVNADKVLLREKANTTCDYYDRLNKGAKVTIVGESGDFYRVTYGRTTGYMMKKFINVSSSVKTTLKKDAEPVSKSQYAKTPSIRALGDPPGNLKYGDSGVQVEKLQRALQLKSVYKGVVDGKFGNGTRDALKAYQKKNKLDVTGKADVPTITKLFGRVLETSTQDDPKMKGITSISQIATPNTTKRGNSGQHVLALQQALKIKGYYKAPIDSSYGAKTVEAVKAFQKRVGLKQDGVAGNDVIKKLFGKNAANFTYETEQLNWFGNEGTIPKGAIFTVKDIDTGITFSARRWSGANHLDAEPINSDNAGKLKKASGGSFSWMRRAVLVKYNGHVYAASMNTMPHGDDTIAGNSYEGHFCIHFLNSKTHETNRKDAAHQNAVARAARNTW